MNPLRTNNAIQEPGLMPGLKKDPYKLLIVDDSRIMRKAIANIFDEDDRVQVVGEAEDGAEAMEMLSQINADVVTLDVEMPIMDGLTTLKHMMVENPTPTVMISTLTHEGTSVTFDALKYGAVDFIPKPSSISGKDLQKQSREISRKVTLAAAVDINSVKYIRAVRKVTRKSLKTPECKNIIAIGAAEGGYGALLKIIPQLPADFPATCLIVLHTEAIHVDAFVRYLNDHSAMKIKRACDGEPVKGGVCYIGPGEEYLTIRKIDNRPVVFANPAPFAARRAVNMLMFSVAETMRNQSIGLILSGSGPDGNEGMAEIHRVGGIAIAQDPKNCMYSEMSKAALDCCDVDQVLSDTDIAEALIDLAETR